MTNTVESPGKARRSSRLRGSSATRPKIVTGEDAAPVAEVPVGPPPRLRRRPMLVAASVAAVVLGAAGSAWVFTSVSDAVPVIAVREAVARGEVIDAQDLVVVQLPAEPGLRPVSADRAEEVVGTRSAVDLPAGGLLTEAAVQKQVSPAAGSSLVGVALPPTLMPGEPLLVGDQVRIVSTPGQGATVEEGDDAGGTPWSIVATVAGITEGDATGGGQSVVDVLVPEDQAVDLAARAATGNVILVLDSRERG